MMMDVEKMGTATNFVATPTDAPPNSAKGSRMTIRGLCRGNIRYSPHFWACVLMLLAVQALAQELPRWAWEAESLYQTVPPGTVDASKVKDPEASGGMVIRGNEQAGFHYERNYTVMQPGEYVAFFKLKVSDNTKQEQIIQASVENGDTALSLRPEQFKAPNAWQDFEVPFSLKTRALVSTPITALRVPGVVVYADKIGIVMKREYGDDEQFRLRNTERHPDYVLPAAATGIWMGRGLYHEFWRVPEVAPFIGSELTTGAVYTDQTEDHLRNFPPTFQELAQRKVVVLANVPATALTLDQRAMLEDFVRAGGGLVVLGGPYSFGAGDYHKSDVFTRLLPVQPAGKYDVVKCAPPALLKSAGENTLAADLLGATPPIVLYRHNLAPKVGATVQVRAGDAPLIVTGTYGKGRVVAVLATPLGAAPANVIPWWNSPLWPQIMVRVLAWAAGQ